MALQNIYQSILVLVLALRLACASISLPRYNITPQDALQQYDWKPRIFILSDILNEPDDSMSLVRYLLYSNEFDTKGICATTSWWLKNETHPEEMKTIIEAYGEVIDNLNHHVHPTAQYPRAEDLVQLITSGPTSYGLAALNDTISDGAQSIISSLQESEEPLYISVWGGTNTLAQALYYMDQTLSPSEASVLRSLIRLYTISDQDDTGAWIRYHYPDVFSIVSIHAFNEYGLATWEGINQADCACVFNETVLNPWLDENIRLGPLGAVYPQITHGMEGDSPAFMWLIQNGLIYRDRIDWGTWGGRCNLPQAPSDVGSPFTANHYVNSLESAVGADNSTWKSVQASIWRWRTAYQDDFAARMQWTLTPSFAEVGHPPVLNVNGHEGPDPIYVPISAYQNYTFNASLTVDTDHPDDNGQLSFLWLVYPEPTTFFPEYLDVNFQPISSETDNANALNDAGFSTIISAQTIQITAPMELENSYTGRPTDFHLLQSRPVSDQEIPKDYLPVYKYNIELKRRA